MSYRCTREWANVGLHSIIISYLRLLESVSIYPYPSDDVFTKNGQFFTNIFGQSSVIIFTIVIFSCISGGFFGGGFGTGCSENNDCSAGEVCIAVLGTCILGKCYPYQVW